MILMTKLSLGQAEQVIYAVEGNNSKKIASVEMTNLGDALSGLYYLNQAERILIQGPHDYAKEIEDDIRTAHMSTYKNNNINIELI